MRIGIQIGNEHTSIASLRTVWSKLDELNIDTLWVWDHLLPIHGDQNGNNFECWSLLAAIAATTRNVTIGSLVTCHAFRAPALLSAMADTVDQVSGGRLILGIGAGWFEPDFTELGIPFETARTRLAAMEQAIDVIQQHSAAAARRGRSIPVMIGAGGNDVGLGIVARRASMWNWFGPVDDFYSRNKALDEWCGRVGRAPGEIERSVTLYEAEELGRLDEYADAGAAHIIFGIREPWNWDAVYKLMDWAAATRRSPA
jgi:alkanesulfonate monooxygenase SsuD/methylene tetrahydromethanopterin reductase-like flavin-dependent oxidoreductase (luciferase family)